MIPPLPDDGRSLVLRRTFMASRQRVFRAWIEPDALARWFKPLGLDVTVSEMDVRVGGSFRFDVENGNYTLGTYLSVIPPEKLVFTWSGRDVPPERETIVTLDFLEQGRMTEVILTHERLYAPAMHETFRGGWLSLFEACSAYLSATERSD